MNEWYFYQERGKTVGPFNLDDIKSRIRDGRIKVFDLIYKDGDASWRMALEHSMLRAEFKNSALSGFKDRPWVVLQRRPGEGQDFSTIGPFALDEIKDKIQSGEISYSDYAWKDGFSEWKRIGSLEEYNPRVRQTVLPPVPKVPETSSVDLLKNVVEMKRLNFSPLDFDLPPEADSDFAPPSARPAPMPRPVPVPTPPTKVGKATFAIGDEVTHVNVPVGTKPSFRLPESKPSAVPPLPIPQTPAPVPAQPPMKSRAPVHPPAEQTITQTVTHDIRIYDSEEEEERARPWLDWGLVGALGVILIASLVISRFYMKRSSTPDAVPALNTTAEPAPPVQAPTAQPVVERAAPVTAPTPPEPVVEKKPPVRRAPESLFLSAQGLGGGTAQPHIVVRSDGTAEYPVYLQIIGLTGQVSEGGAFYRYLRLTPNGNWMRPLDLGALKLPQGKFIVRAETEELKKEVKFSWGSTDNKSKENLARQRKAWAYAIWKERLALYKLSAALESQLAVALQPSKKFSARGWEPLIALKRSSGGNYLMFDDWWELHNIAKEAKIAVNPMLLARAQRQREHLATFSIWK